MSPIDKQQVVVNGLLTSYSRVGEGRPVLCLHGWGDTKATFVGLEAGLKSDFSVIALDLPGFGQSQAPPEVWDLDDYAKFVAAFLTKLSIDPYAVIGHSNGGALAIRSLATGAWPAQKLVLLASAGIRTRQRVKRQILRIVAKVGKLATFWAPISFRQKLRVRLYGVAGSDMLAVPHLEETFKRTVRQDIQADAAELGLPTLLIYGQDDTATPPADGQVLAGLIPGARLEVLEGVGHFVHQDAPDKVETLVKEFLA